MATNQQVLQHITGHTGGTPLQLGWQNFTPVQQPRTAGRSAFTDAPFQINSVPPARPDGDGTFRFQNVRIGVSMNRGSSWVVNGQQTAGLLDHEQGHFNITWLVMRELCRQLLDVEWAASVLTATRNGSPAQVRNQFVTDFKRLSDTAKAEVKRLNDLYDSVPQTNHGTNPTQQGQWDRMFQYAIQNQESDLTTLLMLGGGSPSGF